MSPLLYLPACAVATCLGVGKAATAASLFGDGDAPFTRRDDLLPGRTVPVGAIAAALPPLPATASAHDCRNNRLLAVLLDEIAAATTAIVTAFGRDRVAVVLGTSTSGIAEGEAAFAAHRRTGTWPADFSYSRQETGGPAAFVADVLGLTGPAYVVATACSSSAKVFAAARRLIHHGLADAAIVGGADTLCRLTVAGFSSLEAMSSRPATPFAAGRDGITIGEGGALFVLSRQPAEIALLGIGETSDAHHVSAPDPEGGGARQAMALALADAGLTAGEIATVNLHGTATVLNDAMESKAVLDLFGASVPCTATKGITGHTLGAAGAVEAALLWLTLSPAWNPNGVVPAQRPAAARDPALAPIALAAPGTALPKTTRLAALSSSFAFGGSNCAVVLGRGWGP